MNKSEQTRKRIVETAATVFNLHGYAGTAISDVMTATGLKKGGIYNHFESKEALAAEAFQFAVSCCRKPVLDAVMTGNTALDKLRAVLDAFTQIVENPPLDGGCPINNASSDTTDAGSPVLPAACAALEQRRKLFQMILQAGIGAGEFRNKLDVDATSTMFVSALQGAILACKLNRATTPMRQTVAQLNVFIDSVLLA